MPNDAPASQPRLCECGVCGLSVKPGKRFIRGHNASTTVQTAPSHPWRTYRKLVGRPYWDKVKAGNTGPHKAKGAADEWYE